MTCRVRNIFLYIIRFCRGFASNKIGLFLLQILNETDTEAVEARVADHIRFVRVEAEAARAGATVLSGRPIEAAVLHEGHIGAVAVARSRQEDCTSRFEF